MICNWLKKKKTITHIPNLGDKGDVVKIVQQALKDKGFDPGPIDGVFGKQTLAAVQALQKSKGSAGSGVIGERTLGWLGLEIKKSDQPVNPAYVEAKKYLGKGEHDKAFVKWLSSKWPLVKLNLKTIVGASAAWCALFVAVMNSETGLEYISKYGGLARVQGQIGVTIDYKKDGIPQGAVVHINAKSCKSGSGNHITFSDSACTAKTVNTRGATFQGLGGNQSNVVKSSTYSISKICRVSWPKEIALPSPVVENINCNGGKDGGESTR